MRHDIQTGAITLIQRFGAAVTRWKPSRQSSCSVDCMPRIVTQARRAAVRGSREDWHGQCCGACLPAGPRRTVRSAPALRQIGIHLCVDDKPKRDGVHCELGVAKGFELRVGEIIEISSSPSSRRSQRLEYGSVNGADQLVEAVI